MEVQRLKNTIFAAIRVFQAKCILRAFIKFNGWTHRQHYLKAARPRIDFGQIGYDSCNVGYGVSAAIGNKHFIVRRKDLADHYLILQKLQEERRIRDGFKLRNEGQANRARCDKATRSGALIAKGQNRHTHLLQ